MVEAAGRMARVRGDGGLLASVSKKVSDDVVYWYYITRLIIFLCLIYLNIPPPTSINNIYTHQVDEADGGASADQDGIGSTGELGLRKVDDDGVVVSRILLYFFIVHTINHFSLNIDSSQSFAFIY